MKFTKDEIRSSMLLYAVTDRMWLKEGESLVDVAEKVLQNGATFLQIREKDLDEASFEEESEKLKALCNSYRVPFVVNDSVEIALSAALTASMWARATSRTGTSGPSSDRTKFWASLPERWSRRWPPNRPGPTISA